MIAEIGESVEEDGCSSVGGLAGVSGYAYDGGEHYEEVEISFGKAIMEVPDTVDFWSHDGVVVFET